MNAATSRKSSQSDSDNFMRGKALAALMVRESMSREPGKEADLCASYRAPGSAQDNYTRPMLCHLLSAPELLDGFSAALSSLLVEGMEKLNFAESAATISYDACTVHRAHDDNHVHSNFNAATLDEQIKAYGFDALSAGAPVAEDGAGQAQAARVLTDQAADVLSMLAMNVATSSALWGVHFFAEMVARQFGEAESSRGPHKYQTASNTADGLLGVMDAVAAGEHGGGVFLAAQSLVRLAKAALDGKHGDLDDELCAAAAAQHAAAPLANMAQGAGQ